MRILFVVPYLPSLIRSRPYNLIRVLASRGNEVTLFALHPPGDDRSGLPNLKEWCQSIQVIQLERWRPLLNAVQALFTPIPFQAAYSRSPQMVELINRAITEEDYDIIHLEHLRGAELLPSTIKAPPVVFDAVDSISLLFERAAQMAPSWKGRFLAKLDLKRTRHYEARFTQRFSRVLVTSPEDCNALAALSISNKEGTKPAKGHNLVVLSHGVDLTYFRPVQDMRQPNVVIFNGKMSYHANIAAALDLVRVIMPRVWPERPQTQVWLVGKDPPAVVRELAKDPRVKVTGTVPDIRPYLGTAAMAVAPLRYSVGIQNKVLEAMAMGTPVVTTSATCRALMVEPDTHLLVGDTIPSLAQAILRLLSDADKRHRLGRAGRAFVEKHHDWDGIAALLETVYQEAIDEPIFRIDVG